MMKTLRTLQKMVEVAPPTMVKLPTPAALRESGSAVVEFKITEVKSILLVYENGYVVYGNGSRSTVLRWSSCHMREYAPVLRGV